MANLPQKIKRELPFLPLFIDEVVEKHDHLSKQHKKYGQYINVSVMMTTVVAQLIGGFTYGNYISGVLIIGSIALAAFFYKKQSGVKKEFKNSYEENINGFIAESFASDWTYINDAILFDKTDEDAGIIFEGNIQIMSTDYSIEGTFDKKKVIIRKLKASMRENRRSTVFKGLLLSVDLPFEVSDKVVVTPRSSHSSTSAIGTNLLALHQLNFNLHNDVDPNFTKYFKLYSTKMGRRPVYFSPSLQRQLAHFITNHKVQLHLYISDTRMYASIRTNKDTFKPKLDKDKDIDIQKAAITYYEELKVASDLLRRLDQGQFFVVPEKADQKA